jgi:uncharacterized membrane protein
MDQQSDTQHPSTTEILAEVQRRRSEAGAAPRDGERRVVIWVDRFIFWLTKHWLAVFNVIAFLYVGLPFLAPTLVQWGLEGPARILYAMYRPMCHQLPQRSMFLFGEQLTYYLPELVTRVGVEGLPNYPWPSPFIGTPEVGYKVALCQRDVAIYGTITLSGLVYGVLRRRREVKPLPWWAYILFGIMPMLLDGGFQWISYILPALQDLIPFLPDWNILAPHETVPFMRYLTGALFGWATVWLAYPYVQETMDEFQETLHRRFGWE